MSESLRTSRVRRVVSLCGKVRVLVVPQQGLCSKFPDPFSAIGGSVFLGGIDMTQPEARRGRTKIEEDLDNESRDGAPGGRAEGIPLTGAEFSPSSLGMGTDPGPELLNGVPWCISSPHRDPLVTGGARESLLFTPQEERRGSSGQRPSRNWVWGKRTGHEV